MATITGTSGSDTLAGGVDGDTITGGTGGDLLSGGPGFDLFVYGSSDSLAVNGLGGLGNIDTITDWSGADRFLFLGANQAGFASLYQAEAADYTEAYNVALAHYGTFEYSAILVDKDVFVFELRTGQAVRLAGASLADVQRTNFSYGALDTGLTESGTEGNDARTLTAAVDHYDARGGDNTVNGGAGDDVLVGGSGADMIFGGPDNDSIAGGDGSNYLRGDDGDDQIQGGAGFDDINGNMGRDNLFGGAGDDWVVGGKDNDVCFGEAGSDVVYGNLGDDTVGGGTGNDIVRGGQGNDVVRGDDGNDIVAGDRGDDTLSGGLGADTFIGFSDEGVDRITDFNAAEGDRLQLDPGTHYTLAQVGADTVVDMGGGNETILVGVQLSSLPSGWIYVLGG
ncbi:MAG: calcium-binding protein [Caulobacterales bacterium]|nr:calcium-binding protein [Caulobacterales bacterium]